MLTSVRLEIYLFNSDSESGAGLIAAALGLDTAYGYHIEHEVQAADAFWGKGEDDGSAFPCIDGSRSYAGCLGRYCPAMRCWAGALVGSAEHAVTRMPATQRQGARCHTCGNIAEDYHVSPDGETSFLRAWPDTSTVPSARAVLPGGAYLWGRQFRAATTGRREP